MTATVSKGQNRVLNERYIEMKISKRKGSFLRKNWKEYEKITPVTAAERKVLHEWVAAGYSVHENSSMAVYEGGRPVDFLDVYREEEDIRRALNTMNYEEGSKNISAGRVWYRP